MRSCWKVIDNSNKLNDMNPDSPGVSCEYQELIWATRIKYRSEVSGEYQELTHHMTPVWLIDAGVIQVQIIKFGVSWMYHQHSSPSATTDIVGYYSVVAPRAHLLVSVTLVMYLIESMFLSYHVPVLNMSWSVKQGMTVVEKIQECLIGQ
jgi:hypothetical protein